MIKNIRDWGLHYALGTLLLFSAHAWGANEPLRASADAAAAALGKVTQVKEGRTAPVFLFEEHHTSKAGQIEIAHMLVRLYKSQRVRTIGLEGYSGEKLAAPWASKMTSFERRLNVAGRLLADGELSSAEFLAVAYSDVLVTGIDDREAYKVELDDKAGSASTFYLLLIAEKSMSDAKKREFNELAKAKKMTEALELALNSDPWTKQKYAESRSPATRESIDAQLKSVKSIEDEAKKRNVQVPADLARGMRDLKDFYIAADKRSDVMASRLAQLAASGSPVAGIIGAAHTEKMVELLSKKNVAVAVIRPNALVNLDSSKVDAKEFAGYERKLKGLPVDEKGLGQLLQSKRKPPPVLGQSWLGHKAAIYEATAIVVDRVLVNLDKPPYKFTGLPPGYAVDPKNVSIVGDEVIFAVEFDGDRGRRTVWVRAAHSPSASDQDQDRANIDRRIKSLLAEASDVPPGTSGGGNDKGPPTTPAKVAFDDDPNKKSDKKGEEKTASEKAKAKSKDGKKESPSKETVQVLPDIFARFSDSKELAQKESAMLRSTS